MSYVTRGFAVRIGIVLTIAVVPALAETPITACPFNINTPGNYILNADLTCGIGGITITASNVSLKLNGHKITVPGPPQGIIAITVGWYAPITPVHHVAIQGPGLITGSSPDALAIGILLYYASYSQVTQVAIEGASGIQAGIVATLSNFLTLASNVIGRSGGDNGGRGNGGGVVLYETNSSSVTGNDTSGNGYGIEVSGGSGNSVTNNIANGNSGVGIVINSPSSGARVSGNVANGNGLYGIFNLSTMGQMFSNTAKANGEFDLFEIDQNSCSGLWSNNVFFTANAPCIR